MTKQEMEQYKDKKPVGVYPMCNHGGVEILDIIYGIEDYVVARYNFGEPEEKLHKVKIRSTPSGLPYINLDGNYIRLGECLKV